MISIATDVSLHRVFDTLAWAGGLAMGWGVSRWRLKAAQAAFPREPMYLISLAIGALLGAYAAGSAVGGPLVWSAGHSIVGALAGAIVAIELYKHVKGVKGSTGGLFVAPFAFGVVIGRWGCLLAGLPDATFGNPSALPWAVDLGDGVGRHPVQVYESAALLIFLVVYMIGLALRAPWAVHRGFYFLVIWYGAQRFCWEFLKPYPTLLGPLNLFHFICLAIILYGVVWLARSRTS